MDLFWSLIATRWVQIGTTMVLFGSALFPLYAGPGTSETPGRVRTLHVALASLALVSAMVWVACTLVDVAGDTQSLISGEAWTAFFLDTGFGSVWLFRFACLITLLLVALVTPSPRFCRSRSIIIATLAAALLVSQAWLSHAAAAVGSARLGSVAAYAVHVLAAGAWLGGLVPLAATLRRRSLGAGESAAIRLTLERFSLLGMVAVGLIVLSGLGNIYLRLGSLANLFATSYGRVLGLKLALFAAVLAIAAVNRFVYLRRIQRLPADVASLSQLSRNVVLEQLAGAAIVGLAATLASLAPAD